MIVAVLPRCAVPPDPGQLSPVERGVLATVAGARRRDEWIRGRLAIRRVLGDPDASVVQAADGAPRLVGGTPRSVSLAHDGGWIAVAAALPAWRVGIDLCLRAHAARTARILRWLGLRGEPIDPVSAWSALEAALKVRRWSIEALRDRALELRRDGDDVVVRGLGGDVVVRHRDTADFVIAWARERAA